MLLNLKTKALTQLLTTTKKNHVLIIMIQYKTFCDSISQGYCNYKSGLPIIMIIPGYFHPINHYFYVSFISNVSKPFQTLIDHLMSTSYSIHHNVNAT